MSEASEEQRIDDMEKEIEKRHDVENMKRSYVRGCIKGKDFKEVMTEKFKSKEVELNQMLKDKREEESEVDDFSSESDWNSSEEERDYEHRDSLGKLFDDHFA